MDPSTAPSTAHSTQPLARAYLPQITTRFARIMNLEARLGRDAAKYVRGAENPPAGATPTAWDLFTDEAVAAYRRAGAIVTSP